MSNSGPIPDGVYTLKNGMTYLTGGNPGQRVTLEHIGVVPPQDNQKFDVVYNPRHKTYCFLQHKRYDDDDDGDDDARPGYRYGLSYELPENRNAIIIGEPRHFTIITEIFGADKHYELTIGGGPTEKFSVGLTPADILPQGLDLLHESGVLFEFLKG